jgi:hypothetical protein
VSTSETPVIAKNVLMREKRRSSFSLRGKRTSAIHGLCRISYRKLILQIASPHATIATFDWYKFIDAEQSDPIRFRQLLAWCAALKTTIAPKIALPETPLQKLGMSSFILLLSCAS